jgi:hypothetical protein
MDITDHRSWDLIDERLILSEWSALFSARLQDGSMVSRSLDYCDAQNLLGQGWEHLCTRHERGRTIRIYERKPR